MLSVDSFRYQRENLLIARFKNRICLHMAVSLETTLEEPDTISSIGLNESLQFSMKCTKFESSVEQHPGTQ